VGNVAKLKLEHRTKFPKWRLKRTIKKLLKNPPEEFRQYYGSHLEYNWSKNSVYFRFQIIGTHFNGLAEIHRKLLIIELSYHEFYSIIKDEIEKSIKELAAIYFPQKQ
jgi:hypothetical protein